MVGETKTAAQHDRTVYVNAARAVKVAKLVRVLDAALVRDELNPASWEAIHQIEDLTALGRATAEMLAGVNRGSECTWHDVVETYRSRKALVGGADKPRVPSKDDLRECEGCSQWKPVEEMAVCFLPGTGESYQCIECRGGDATDTTQPASSNGMRLHDVFAATSGAAVTNHAAAPDSGNAAEPPPKSLLDRWDEKDRKARDTETGREDEDGND